jgi:cytochrome c-type biogenesis protein CcmF
MTPAFVGRLALGLALAVAAYGAVAAVVGGRRRDDVLVESSRTTAYSLLALAAVAFAALAVATLGDDFSLGYVAANSSRETPTFFKVLSVWSADEGSLLLWTLVLAGYVAAVAHEFATVRPPGFHRAMAVLYGVACFYLVLVLGPATPFTAIDPASSDGRGPLPLLQNHPLMAIHPPMLYLGFIGFTVPFAFAIAALATPGADAVWITRARRWASIAWVFLTAGLILGALWSYGVLGWGGYWAWDPVENAAILPWFTATALLHALRLRERGGGLPVWVLTLALLTFALTVFGTFLTRGTILDSVHTFADSLVGPLYLALLALVLFGGFGLLAVRSARRRRTRPADHVLSREASLLANNLLMMLLAFVVALGTVFPLIAEALTGERVSVGGPYFDRNVAPLAALVVLLLGVGPLVAWRRDDLRSLLRRLWPAFAAVAVIAPALAIAGIGDVVALLALSAAAFAATATLVALVGAVRRRAPRRTLGGLVAHLGFVVLVVGVVTSTAFRSQSQLTIAEGSSRPWHGYDVRFDGLRQVREPQRRVVTATLTLLDDGEPVQTLTPSFNLYPSTREPVGTPSLRVGTPANGFVDLYASLLSARASGSSITLRLSFIPGVALIWLGGALMVLGGLALVVVARRSRVVVGRDRPDIVREVAEVAS